MGAPRVALALGSGSARGWAHIGVLREFEAAGIAIDVVAGTSIGALVGAAYAAGDLDRLESWVGAMTWRDVLALVDPAFSGGLLKGDKLMGYFGTHFNTSDFAALHKPFGCVATDLANGREVWLQSGIVLEAVRASIAMPGLFSPVRRNGTFLVDGALVNPVPVSLARAMGGEVVIAVDLGSDLIGRSSRLRNRMQAAAAEPERSKAPDEAAAMPVAGWLESLRKLLPGRGEADVSDVPLPTLLDVLNTSINIMQTRIARSRLAGEPADVLLQPRLAQIGLLEYHRAKEAIAEGRAAAKLAMPMVARLLEDA